MHGSFGKLQNHQFIRNDQDSGFLSGHFNVLCLLPGLLFTSASSYHDTSTPYGASSGTYSMHGGPGQSAGPTIHAANHTAPLALPQPYGGIEPPVVNRPFTSMLDNRAPVMYPDSRPGRNLAQSNVDISSASRFSSSNLHDRPPPSRDPAGVSPFSPGVGTGTDMDTGYMSIRRASQPAHSSREHSGPAGWSGQQRSSGPQQGQPGSGGSSGHHPYSDPHNAQGHISTDNVQIGAGMHADDVVLLQRQLDEVKRRHAIIIVNKDEQLAHANERVCQLEFDLSSRGMSRQDLERRDSEIRSLHEQVQMMTQNKDRARQDIEGLKDELRQSHGRELSQRQDIALLNGNCTKLQVELDHCRSRNEEWMKSAATASSTTQAAAGGGSTENKMSRDDMIKSFEAKLDQAQLRTQEFERHAKSVELEKEKLRKELELKESMVVSLTSQVSGSSSQSVELNVFVSVHLLQIASQQ